MRSIIFSLFFKGQEKKAAAQQAAALHVRLVSLSCAAEKGGMAPPKLAAAFDIVLHHAGQAQAEAAQLGWVAGQEGKKAVAPACRRCWRVIGRCRLRLKGAGA
jgi:hypothetical protein